MFHIGVTGTRHGLTAVQRTALDVRMQRIHGMHGPICVHYRDCIGAEVEAHEIASRLRFEREIHPSSDESARAFCAGDRTHEPKADPHLDIVDACSVLFATPSGTTEEQQSDTWATVRYAREQGKPTCLIFPDGSCRVESAAVGDNLLGLATSVDGLGI